MIVFALLVKSNCIYWTLSLVNSKTTYTDEFTFRFFFLNWNKSITIYVKWNYKYTLCFVYLTTEFHFHYILLLKSLFWNSLTKSWAKFPPWVPVRFTVLFHIISSRSLRGNHPWIAEKKQSIWIYDTVIITFLKADNKHYKVFSLEKGRFFPPKKWLGDNKTFA